MPQHDSHVPESRRPQGSWYPRRASLLPLQHLIVPLATGSYRSENLSHACRFDFSQAGSLRPILLPPRFADVFFKYRKLICGELRESHFYFGKCAHPATVAQFTQRGQLEALPEITGTKNRNRPFRFSCNWTCGPAGPAGNSVIYARTGIHRKRHRRVVQFLHSRAGTIDSGTGAHGRLSILPRRAPLGDLARLDCSPLVDRGCGEIQARSLTGPLILFATTRWSRATYSPPEASYERIACLINCVASARCIFSLMRAQ